MSLQLETDRGGSALDVFVCRRVMGGRVNRRVCANSLHFSGETVDLGHAFDFVAKKRHACNRLLGVGRVHVDCVAPYTDAAAPGLEVVPGVLDVDQLANDRVAILFHTGPEVDHEIAIVLGIADAINAGNTGHHDDVAPLHDRGSRRVAQPVYLIVDGRVLLDIGVGGGNVRLRLVVVIIADKVLDSVVREKRLELGGQLGGQRLVVGDDQRRPLQALDDVRHRERLAGACDTEQGLGRVAGQNAGDKLVDRLGLVAAGRHVGCDFEKWHVVSLLSAGSRR